LPLLSDVLMLSTERDADDVCAEAQGGPTLTPSGRPIAWCGLDAPSMANGRSGR